MKINSVKIVLSTLILVLILGCESQIKSINGEWTGSAKMTYSISKTNQIEIGGNKSDYVSVEDTTIEFSNVKFFISENKFNIEGLKQNIFNGLIFQASIIEENSPFKWDLIDENSHEFKTMNIDTSLMKISVVEINIDDTTTIRNEEFLLTGDSLKISFDVALYMPQQKNFYFLLSRN
jgi:hypothetical protein